jgi:hypothetical protein
VTQKQLVLVCVICLGMSALFSGRARAQSATTSLRGTVTDTGGGVVVRADIALTNPTTGFNRAQQTDARGEYQFLQIPPGTYAVSASAAGFGNSRKDNVQLLVNSPATLNFLLKVGSVSTTVDVRGEAPAVNIIDATIGNPFDSKQILAIPSEGRNAVEILSLQPGVAYVGNQVNTEADSRGGAVNGARSDQTNVTVDGLDNNDQLLGNAFTGALRIPLDSLEEFRVTTTNSNADSGRSSGAQVSLVTKSGTNQFHGTAYEYNRSTLGVANDWFNKRQELQNGLPNTPPKLIRNTFGAAVGGPIVKNRVFFFANYEGQRSRETVQVTNTVPSANLRKGILTYACDVTDPKCAVGNPGVTAGPQGQLLVTLQPADLRSIDQGCLLSGTCAPGTNGVNPAVLNIWNGMASLPNGKAIPAFPFPNTTSANNSDGFNILGFTFAAPRPQDLNTYLIKLDVNISQNGNHRLFVRGNLQGDGTKDAPEFPGQPASQVLRDNSKGIAIGYTAILSTTLINSFHYGFIRQGTSKSGPNPFQNVAFTSLSDPVSFLRTTNVNVPVHQFVDDVTWTRGKHTLQFGINWRLVFNNRVSDNQSFHFGDTNPTFLANVGIANTGQDLDPAIGGFPAVDPNFAFSYDAAVTAVTGIVGETEGFYNQTKSSNFLPQGALIPRHYKANELEFYAQDAWHVTPNLQLTLGLRYSLLQPPYETTGNQVAPSISLNKWFKDRGAAMQAGQPFNQLISFDLSGQANGRKPYWNWDYKDIAPRLAFAYSPHADSGFVRTLLGDPGRSSLRGGYGIYYDHFGEGIVNTFDRQNSFGLTAILINASNVSTTDCVVRLTSITTVPAGLGCPAVPGGPRVNQLPGPPTPGFPITPNSPFFIGWGLDDKMKTPYSHVFDLSITRELPHSFVFEAAYVGRLGRRLLQEVDLAQPLNITDPSSRTTYYQAATQLAILADAQTPIGSVNKIPYWENLFPGAAGGGNTATQNIYQLYVTNLHNGTSALQSLDQSCIPACSILNGGNGFAFYDQQFASLFAWRSSSRSSYNALQLMLRHHAGGLQFDLNYVYSKSLDEASNAERISEYENGGGTIGIAFNSQALNAWNTHQLYAPSDFDTTHQINSDWVYDLPFGHGRRIGAESSRWVDAILGGWQVSGLVRWTSGYPFSVTSGKFPTNFQQSSNAVLIGPRPVTGRFTDAQGDPNVFKDPVNAPNAFRFPYPGESGQRNNLRGPGYFGTDASLSKVWKFTESQSLRFGWDVFNVFNAVRFDVGTLGPPSLNATPSFGKFTQTLTKPRVMQFAFRYSF